MKSEEQGSGGWRMSSGGDAGGSWGETDVCVRVCVLSARSGMQNSCFAWSGISGHGAQGRISPGAASTCGAARRRGHRRTRRARTSSKRMRELKGMLGQCRHYSGTPSTAILRVLHSERNAGRIHSRSNDSGMNLEGNRGRGLWQRTRR
jgi:hypothetical protein